MSQELQQLEEIERQLEATLQLVADMKQRFMPPMEPTVVAPETVPPKPAKTLKECIYEVLDNSNEPLTAREVTDLLLEQGYVTTSGNFLSVVLQTLMKSPDFVRATRTRPNRFRIA